MTRPDWRPLPAFLGCLMGSSYVALMLRGYLHEVAGHGWAAVLLGGRFEAFQVDLAGRGWARYSGIPEDREWIARWAGIAVDAVAGLTAMGLARRAHSTHSRLALSALGCTCTLMTLSYVLSSALTGIGDAAPLHDDLHGWAHVVVVALLILAGLAAFDWTLRRLVDALDRQFAPPEPLDRQQLFLATVLLPVILIAVAWPASILFSTSLDAAFRVVSVVVVGGWGLYRCAGRVPPTGPSQRVTWRGAMAWLACAAALAIVTARWSQRGVVLAP